MLFDIILKEVIFFVAGIEECTRKGTISLNFSYVLQYGTKPVRK